MNNRYIENGLGRQQATTSEPARTLLDNNFKLQEIKEEEVNLETAFMRLTKGMVQ